MIRIRSLAFDVEPRARIVALVALAVIYSGGERYFASVSRLVHYGFDAVLLAAVAVLVIARPNRDALRLLPYAVWICLYYAWGFAVSSDQSVIRSPAVSDVILNGLILSTVAFAVGSRSDASRVAMYIQLAVILNLVFAIAQAVNYHVLVEMSQILAPGTLSYNLYRPAGLWVNPNVAGIGYLFGFLVSLLIHQRRVIAWLGRAAAAVGILFTGSREAMYPLLFACGVLALLLAYRRSRRLKWLTAVKIPAIVPALIGVVVVGTSLAAWFSPMREPITYNLHRFLDASARGPAEPSRVQLAAYWIGQALRGPWYGSGVFSFQGNGRTILGAHNIYITVWGEVGAALVAVYLAVLAIGIVWVVRAKLPTSDRVTLALMWLTYLVLGFTWHNQFSAVESIVVVGLLYMLPAAMTAPSAALARPFPLEPGRASTWAPFLVGGWHFRGS